MKNDIEKTTSSENDNSSDLIKQLHFCIEKVTKSLDNFQYNVAVASLREFANYFFTLKLKIIIIHYMKPYPNG